MKLNVGAGRTAFQWASWTNLDIEAGPGIDIVGDIQNPATLAGHGPFDEFRLSHLIEHLERPLDAMANLWDAAEPGATMTIIAPHGATDEAWEDQTHLRAYFPKSFLAFGQPYYHLADYGYRADWQVTRCVVEVRPTFRPAEGDGPESLGFALAHFRNICRNMIVTMEAVKPARAVTDPLTFPGLTVQWLPE